MAGVEIAVKKKKVPATLFFVIMEKALVDPTIVVSVNPVAMEFACGKLAAGEVFVLEGELSGIGEI